MPFRKFFFPLLIGVLTVIPAEAATAGYPDAVLMECVRSAIPLANKIRGNTQLFVRLTKPMAPLDLNIRRPLDSETESRQKNFFFGVMGAAAGLSQSEIEQLPGQFFEKNRPDRLLRGAAEKAARVQELATRFAADKEVFIVSTWDEDAYRVNDVFATKDTATDIPSGQAPYFPCVRKESMQKNSDPRIAGLLERAKPLLIGMRRLELVAIVKQDDGIRAVIDGQSDNEVGFWIPRTGEGVPISFVDGKDVIFSQLVAPGIYFYGAN